MSDKFNPVQYLKGKLCWYLKSNILKLLEPEFELIEIRIKILEEALDKACEQLEWTCPVDQELVEDLNCDGCDNNCKECWKKYFMKEVLGSE